MGIFFIRLKRAFQKHISYLNRSMFIAIVFATVLFALVYTVVVDSNVRDSHETAEKLAMEFAGALLIFVIFGLMFEPVHSRAAIERTQAIARDVFGPLGGAFMELSGRQNIIRDDIEISITLERMSEHLLLVRYQLDYFFFNKEAQAVTYHPTVEHHHFPSRDLAKWVWDNHSIPRFRIQVFSPQTVRPYATLDPIPQQRRNVSNYPHPYVWEAQVEVLPSTEAFYQFHAEWVHVSNDADYYDLTLSYLCSTVKITVTFPPTLNVDATAASRVTALPLMSDEVYFALRRRKWTSVGPCFPGQSFHITWQP